MQNTLKIAVIGGSGKSGKYLVRQLSGRNIPFKMLLRDPGPSPVNHPLIEVITGDVRDYSAVRLLTEGCSAVISTLGQPKGETPVFSQATTNVIRAMEEHRIKRYVLITGLNVDMPQDRKGPATASATTWMKTNYPLTTADKQTEAGILSASHINWTLVRLPLIGLTDDLPEIRVSLEDCPGDKIGATSLAHFLIGQLSDSTYVRKAPFIANL
ncbi:MAG TPA: NAD(P)H-binding protein [Puia sp.]|jgi:nucleoside-diphosphate-sugar epimerase